MALGDKVPFDATYDAIIQLNTHRFTFWGITCTRCKRTTSGAMTCHNPKCDASPEAGIALYTLEVREEVPDDRRRRG